MRGVSALLLRHELSHEFERNTALAGGGWTLFSHSVRAAAAGAG